MTFKCIYLTILSVFFLFLFSVSVSAVNTYEIDFYQSNSGNLFNLDFPSFYSELTTCETQINGYANFSSPVDLHYQYFSPNDTLITDSYLQSQYDLLCEKLGLDSTKNSLNNLYESRIRYITNTSGLGSGFTKYICNSTSDFITLYSGINYRDNKIGNYSMSYTVHGCGTPPPKNQYNSFKSNFDLCKSPFDIGHDWNITENCFSGGHTISYFIPINSTNGNVSYSLQLGYSGLQSEIAVSGWNLTRMKDDSTFSLLYQGSNEYPTETNGNIKLNPNEIYIFHGWITFGGGSTGIDVYLKKTEITIEIYKPEWECGEWTECENGYQQRKCIDKLGKSPNKIETKTCLIVELENLTLGFEDYYTEDLVRVCVPNWVTLCSPMNIKRNVDRPLNWTIIEPNKRQYFLSMTNEWFTEGTRSLKMWYIPPSDFEADSLVNDCINLTEGRVPQIYKGVNDSYFVARNITFPTSNMILSFDYKKCKNNVQSFGKITGYLGLVNCPEKCYGNCSEEPEGRFYFNILDVNTSKSILSTKNGWFDIAELRPKSKRFDLSNLGIIPNKTYNIVFAVVPESLNDNKGYCVMFDNVRYAVLKEPIVCVSECVGLDYYKREIVNGECVIDVTKDSLECMSESKRENVENCEEFCDDSNLHIPTEDCIPHEYPDYIIVENHSDCITEEKEKTIYDSLIDIDSKEMAWFGRFSSPFMIIFYIIIIAVLISAYLTESWEIGMLSGFLILIAVGSIFTELAWIVAIVVIIGGLLFGRYLVQHRGGGG